MQHKAIILRLNRNVAGAKFPFDKTYFFKKEARKHLPRIFRSALVIAPAKSFAEMLGKIVVEPLCAAGKAYPIRRRDEETTLQTMKEELPIHDVVSNYENYLGLVPILFLQNRSKPSDITPRYLHADMKIVPGQSWRRTRNKRRTRYTAQEVENRALDNMQDMLQDVFTSESYFLIDGEEYQPVCTACANSLAMVTGQCHLGGGNCLENLARVDRSNFRRNMDQYANWLKGVGEPELQLETKDE